MECGGVHVEPSEGKLTYSNTELTHAAKIAQDDIKRLKSAIKTSSFRRRHVLDITGNEIPAASLAGCILIVPAEVSADKMYCLPAPAAVKPYIAGRGYEIDIRNDSSKQVTLVSEHKTAKLDGGNTIGQNSGSRWYISMLPQEGMGETYELVRLS
jgi:hypothetical protein